MKDYRYAVYEEGKLIGKYETITDVVKNCIYTKEDHEIWYNSLGKELYPDCTYESEMLFFREMLCGFSKEYKIFKIYGNKKFFLGWDDYYYLSHSKGFRTISIKFLKNKT